MVSLGEYGLTWCGTTEPASSSGCGKRSKDPAHGQGWQYIFAAKNNTEEPLISSLRRAETLPDLFEALLGHSVSGSQVGPAVAVASLALLGGNLLATGRWVTFLVFLSAYVASAIYELHIVAMALTTFMGALFALTLWTGAASLKWLATEAVLVLVALVVVTVVVQLTQEDPRGHVLVPIGDEQEEVVVQNDCCQDVKVLVFDWGDFCRLVPKGGLLSGLRLERGASHSLGKRPPYCIKVYAPWERELGNFEVTRGRYSLRETDPAIVLSQTQLSPPKNPKVSTDSTTGTKTTETTEATSETTTGKTSAHSTMATRSGDLAARVKKTMTTTMTMMMASKLNTSDTSGWTMTSTLTNSSEEHVAVCVTSLSCWTCSLWLPLTPLLARLVGWPVTRLAPEASMPLPSPCFIRIYSSGMFSALSQRASATVREEESAEYIGILRWTVPPAKVRKSTSALFKIH